MNFKRRITLKLRNHTPANFALWKSLEDEIGSKFLFYGLIQSGIIYGDNTKSITIEYDSFEIYSEAVIIAAQFGASKGLLIEQVSVENLDTKEIKCENLISNYRGKKYA